MVNVSDWRLPAAFAALAFVAAPADGADVPAPTEWDVKAAYLYNFTRFVEWPDRSTTPADTPFVIGILGRDPFGRVLDDTLSGKTVDGRPIVVRRLERAEEAASVQILFLGQASGRETERALRAVRGRPVLTVGDGDGPARRGVVLTFRIRESRVRFDVDLHAADEAGLKISSQLLKLALAVEGRR